MRKYEALRLSLYILVPLLSTTSLVYKLHDSWPTIASSSPSEQQPRQQNHYKFARALDTSAHKITAPNHYQSKVSFPREISCLVSEK